MILIYDCAKFVSITTHFKFKLNFICISSTGNLWIQDSQNLDVYNYYSRSEKCIKIPEDRKKMLVKHTDMMSEKNKTTNTIDPTIYTCIPQAKILQ